MWVESFIVQHAQDVAIVSRRYIEFGFWSHHDYKICLCLTLSRPCNYWLWSMQVLIYEYKAPLSVYSVKDMPLYWNPHNKLPPTTYDISTFLSYWLGGEKTRKALEQKRSISQEVITVIFYWLTADPLIAPPPQAASGSVIAGTITGILVAIIVIAVAMVFVNRSGFLFIFIFLMRIKILKHNVHRRRWVAWFLTIDQTIVIPAL